MTTDAPAFTFDEATHTYKVGSVVYPSVTQIIRAAGMMPWLDHMEQREPEQMEACRERGTRIHEVIAMLNRGKDWRQSQAFNELDYFGESGYVNAYLEWLECSQFTPNPNSVESRFHSHKFHYAGTIDFYGLDRAGNPTIVDIKSGGFEPAARLQLAAYQHSRGDMGASVLKHRVVLRLKRDGTYQVHPLPIAENSVDWNAFQSCLNVWNWKALRKLNHRKEQAA